MDRINQGLQTENCALIECITEVEAENHHLNLVNDALKKSLEKQKTRYRNFSNDVIESERLRDQSYKSEERSLLGEKKLLLGENAQLKKDLTFYKAEYEELVEANNTELTEHRVKDPTVKDRGFRSSLEE